MKKCNFLKRIAAALMAICIGTIFSFPVFATENEVSAATDKEYAYIYTLEIENGEVKSISSVNGGVVIDSPLTSGVMNVSSRSRRVGFSFLLAAPYTVGTGTITFKKGETRKNVLVGGSSILQANGRYYEGNFGTNSFDNYLTSGSWTVIISSSVPILSCSISVAT